MSVYTILNFASKTCRSNIYKIPKRPLFHWINKQFNALDEDRKKQVGPDRVCAEWILRNGGKVKFVDAFEPEVDYNHLPKEEVQIKLQEIDATGSSIMGNGFEHLKGCNKLSKIILDQCSYMENDALEGLVYVKDSLLFLQVSRCGNITEEGLMHLLKLNNLRTLIIFGLPYLKDRKKMLDVLKSGLKTCNITFNE